jgi:DNA polymerase (family 10)
MKRKGDFTNLQIAELLRDVAAGYRLKGEDKYKFRIIAYDRAADAVEHATSELKDLWDDGKLEDVPGIGPSISAHLDELFRTGRSRHFEEITKDIPPEAFKLMQLPGIGIKTAMKMLKEGDKKEVAEKLKEVKALQAKNKRLLLPIATQIATDIINYLSKDKSVIRIDPLGSLRRKASTIGDIDIAVASSNPKSVLQKFVKYPKSQKVIEKGDHTASILLPGDIRVDLMVQSEDSYGALLQHFTGSKHHNIALREFALKKGFSLSEYGIKKVRGEDLSTGKVGQKVKAFKTEQEFYKYLGLEYIEPELREDTGEIEAALRQAQGKPGGLPKLIELGDVRADLQIHSSFDVETSHDLGESSMEEIVQKGNELGYEYLAFTDHNPSQVKHNESQILDILKRKREKVEQINYSIKRDNVGSIKKVFNSLEIDIKPDGTLPVPNSGMSTLDFALVSIHSSFHLERNIQTKRVLSALSHPKVKIFAHPTGRLLEKREGAELNWPEIFDFCLKNGKWIEINCDPMRLDLPDSLVREAVKLGVKLTLGTDAHHKDGMNNMIWGVSVARRGWCQKSDIINTLNLLEFEKLIK